MNRIDSNQLSQLQSQAKKTDTAQKTNVSSNPSQAADTAATSAASDTVQISDTGRQLNELEKQLDTKAFDQQRVSMIKQAVDDGTYKPNAMAIAQKMVSFDN